MNKSHKVLMYLASLWVTMVAYQGKATEPFRYDLADSLGKIKDMVLSSDNKMFALKTTGAKIQDTEYPVWVGNTENLGAAFSSSWMTNATSSCAFFKDKLYLAPKAETNYLYCVDVGTNHIPNVKSAKMLKFDAQGLTKMQAPYLYATTNNLYAIEDTPNGVRVLPLTENDQKSFSSGQFINVNSSGAKSIKTAQIKDIVSKEINGEDCLYILTTNTAQTANLWLVKTNAAECITPKGWSEYNTVCKFTPLFDHTTSIAMHNNTLLSANANYKADGENYVQWGLYFPFQPNGSGKLGMATPYVQSDMFRTSAIGSDQKKYYAEAINHASNSMDPSLGKYFLKGDLKSYRQANSDQNNYPVRSFSRQGAAVYKFITRKAGEIFAISPDRVYRIR